MDRYSKIAWLTKRAKDKRHSPVFSWRTYCTYSTVLKEIKFHNLCTVLCILFTVATHFSVAEFHPLIYNPQNRLCLSWPRWLLDAFYDILMFQASFLGSSFSFSCLLNTELRAPTVLRFISQICKPVAKLIYQIVTLKIQGWQMFVSLKNYFQILVES